MEWKDLMLDSISAAAATQLRLETISQKLSDERWADLEEAWRKSGKTRYHLFSVMDCAFLAAWEDAGIPDEAIVTGVERTLASHRGPRPINSLSYCEPEIYRAWQDFMERRR